MWLIYLMASNLRFEGRIVHISRSALDPCICGGTISNLWWRTGDSLFGQKMF